MDYFPAVIYQSPTYFWPVIDNAIRSAAYQGASTALLRTIGHEFIAAV